jgi:hypothetical protein
MEAANGNVSSYTSNTAGAGTVNNTGNSSTNLAFTVHFAGSNRRYPVVASAAGTGYSGSANSSGIEGGEDPWTATVTPEPDDDFENDSEDCDDGSDGD